MIRLCLFTAICWLLSAAPIAAMEELRLKRDISVDGEEILIGDMFTGAGEKGDITVALADAPGTRTHISTRRLKMLLARHGLTWRPNSNSKYITVRRRGVQLDTQGVEAALHDALANENVPEQYILKYERGPHPIYIAPSLQPDYFIRDVNVSMRRQQFSASLNVQITEDRWREYVISGRIFQAVNVAVPRIAMAADTAIKPEDVTWIKVRASRMANGAITDPEQLAGMVAKRPLRPGRSIRAIDVQRPLLVRKGALVRMVVEAPGLTLSTLGRAMADAAKGEMVYLRNPTSERIVQGIVTGPEEVHIPHPSAPNPA